MKQLRLEVYDGEPPFACCLFHKDIKPGDENFLQMLRFTFFPFFQLYSFTFFWLITIIFVYIYSLYLDNSDSAFISNEFLRVSQKALFDLGQNYPYFLVKKMHYYRLLTSTVLCRNLYHFILCSVGIIIFGSYIQQLVGFKRILLISITTGVGGEIIRNIFFSQATIESVTPICGLIGYMLGYYKAKSETKWKYFARDKLHMLLVMFAMLLLYVQLSFLYRNVCKTSMACGFGLGVIFYFCDPGPKYERISKWAIIALIAVVGGSVMWLFFETDPRLVEL